MRFWILSAFACAAVFAANTTTGVTFHKDVLPILQNKCQECHRPGEAAPMSLLSYKEARPWAKAIKEAVLVKRMPPWFAEAGIGKFHNERRLSDAEVNTIAGWADSGAPEGSAKDAPRPRQFVEGWNIGKPDLEFEIGMDFPVQASGTIEYTYFMVPSNFTEDRWVERVEVRPGNRAVVHHVIAFTRAPGAKWMQEIKPGVPYVPKRVRGGSEGDGGGGGGRELLVGYAPGLPPTILRPGQAIKVAAGSDIIFQLHYTANGKEATDRSKIGLIFAKEPPKHRVLTMGATNARFVIPANADHHQVDSTITLREDTQLVSLMPHMHLRGKDFEYRATFPTGESKTLLRVPKYDFNWQLFYYLDEEMLLPKGTRIDCTAHFDNSANNKANPDPSKEVRWGDQSWEEMMIGWFTVAFPANEDPMKIFRAPRAQR